MNKNKSLTNNLNKISCVLIVKNGQSTIRQVLESLQSFSDVVIYNNHSTDDTVKIASGFQNTRIINGDFLVLVRQKTKQQCLQKMNGSYH